MKLKKVKKQIKKKQPISDELLVKQNAMKKSLAEDNGSVLPNGFNPFHESEQEIKEKEEKARIEQEEQGLTADKRMEKQLGREINRIQGKNNSQ